MRVTVDNAVGSGLEPENRLQRNAIRFLDRLRAARCAGDGYDQVRNMSLIAFAIRIISAGIAFLAQIFLARMMGPFEYGIFVFVWVMAVIAGNLSCLGFHTAIIRFLPQYQASGHVEEIRGLTVATRLVSFGIASVVALIGIGMLYLFADHVPAHYLVPVTLGAILLPMIALGDAMDGTARANSWVAQALAPTFLVRPVLIPVVMVAAIWLGFDATAETGMIAAIIATYLTTTGQLLLLGRRLHNRFEAGRHNYQLVHWGKVALPIFLIEGFYFLLTNSDVVMVGLFLQPEDVATYFAAAKSIALVHFVYFAVKAGMTPRFSQLVARNEPAELSRFAAMAARWTFVPSLAVGATVLLMGPLLLSLFGPDYSAGYSVMFILFAGIAAKALVGPGEALLSMAGQQKICALIYLAVLLVNVAGNILLIPRLGINGAATATMLAMLVEALLLFVIIRTRLGISMFVLSNLSADKSEWEAH